MKLLLDVNVVLDVLLMRRPHVEASSKILNACEHKQFRGVVCATSVTTLYYLTQKARDRQTANKMLERLLQICEVATVNDRVIQKALQAGWEDFEDAVIHEAAVLSGCDCIVTRNISDFKKAQIDVYTPDEMRTVMNV